MEELAKSFEKGRKYSENEVNDILLAFHDDYCTIRRDMISEGILARENAVYVRL